MNMSHPDDTVFETRFAGDTYRLRANFAEATCAIDRDTSCGDEGGWEPTGKQVADYGHHPEGAMFDELCEAVRTSGEDPDDYEDEIEEAVAKMIRSD